jgi:hypothetical protein
MPIRPKRHRKKSDLLTKSSTISEYSDYSRKYSCDYKKQNSQDHFNPVQHGSQSVHNFNTLHFNNNKSKSKILNEQLISCTRYSNYQPSPVRTDRQQQANFRNYENLNQKKNTESHLVKRVVHSILKELRSITQKIKDEEIYEEKSLKWKVNIV